jgi:23S rRNA pseudoU1915 N3-methylase RlmH
MSDALQLGGNIELAGFREIDPASMVVLKKIVGNYARRFSEQCSSFEKLSLNIKKVHETEGSKKFEIHGMVIDKGKTFTSEITDRNMFVVVDMVLKKIESEMKK